MKNMLLCPILNGELNLCFEVQTPQPNNQNVDFTHYMLVSGYAHCYMCTCRFSATVEEKEDANEDQNHEDFPFCCSSFHACSRAASLASFLALSAATSSSSDIY